MKKMNIKIIKRNRIEGMNRKVDLQLEKSREQKFEKRKWND